MQSEYATHTPVCSCLENSQLFSFDLVETASNSRESRLVVYIPHCLNHVILQGPLLSKIVSFSLVLLYRAQSLSQIFWSLDLQLTSVGSLQLKIVVS